MHSTKSCRRQFVCKQNSINASIIAIHSFVPSPSSNSSLGNQKIQQVRLLSHVCCGRPKPRGPPKFQPKARQTQRWGGTCKLATMARYLPNLANIIQYCLYENILVMPSMNHRALVFHSWRIPCHYNDPSVSDWGPTVIRQYFRNAYCKICLFV